MGYSNQFFDALGISGRKDLVNFSEKSSVPMERLKYYNKLNVVPCGQDLEAVLLVADISEFKLKLHMGRLDSETLKTLQDNLENLVDFHKIPTKKPSKSRPPKAQFTTRLGSLYQGDCLDFLRCVDDDSVDLVFADPPFNLNKLYPSEIDDQIKTEHYIEWCEKWIYECIRVLAHGGALFLWNLPKWNSVLSRYIGHYLTFRNWISVDIKYSLPIQGRLYPSHYSLLYFVKGEKPNTFHPDRLPMQICPKCFCELKDYGGYKNKMNPDGINLTDVWLDIPPVRHAKYKRRQGANELSLKLMDRIIEMSTNEGDLVLDPFGGSGTTYMAAELKNRRWIGSEIGPIKGIADRFGLIDEERSILQGYRNELNALFPEPVKRKRQCLGLWTCETL
jgi:site-specific DNA-methyltransferase (adenine-specific)